MTRVAIVGGSIGGLGAALALARAGAVAWVFERAPGRQRSPGAGMGVDLALAAAVARRPADTLAHLRLHRRVVAGSHVAEQRVQLDMTAYHLVRGWLHAALPADRYHAGRDVVAVEPGPDQARVRFADGEVHGYDAVIVADGRLSLGRGVVAPSAAQPRYAGYVLWRGFVAESDLPPETHAYFFDDPGLHIVPRGRFHMVVYPVPDENGDTAPGRRRLNWGWYYGASEERLRDELLVDSQGQRHAHGLPAGELHASIASELLRQSAAIWPAAYHEVVRTTIEQAALSLHPVYEYLPVRLVAGRVCLLGDAAHLASPITGSGVRMAMHDALALEQAFEHHGADVSRALQRYEALRLHDARAVVASGMDMGAAFRAPLAA